MSVETLSAPHLIWRAAGEPAHKYAEEAYAGPCATCGASCAGAGVNTEEVNSPTFANHAEFFKFGSHVCRACAWLYGDPKRTHRNVLCVGDELWWPMISAESATEERPSWSDLFFQIYSQPEWTPDAPFCGVLTTDPKPRNWPRMRLCTVTRPGLYVHAPDYDVSEYRTFDAQSLIGIEDAVREALLLGFSKQRIYTGLLSDYAKAKKNMKEVMKLEEEFREYRKTPEFVPALLIAQVTKEEKDAFASKRAEHGASDTGGALRAGEAGGKAHQDDDRLF